MNRNKPMSEIKTRDKVRDIKPLDRSFIAKERLKRSIAKARRSTGAEYTENKPENPPENYAEEKTTAAAEEAAAVTANIGVKVGRRFGQKRFLRRKTQTSGNIPVGNTDKVAATEQAIDNPIEQVNSSQQEHITEPGRRRARKQAQKRIDGSGFVIVRDSAAVRVENATNTRAAVTKSSSRIKTAGKGAESGAGFIPELKTARYAKADYIAVVGRGQIKATWQHTAKMIKEALIASGQKLLLPVFLIAQALLVLLVAVLLSVFAVLTASSFGIFFSGEDSGTGQTMRTAVADINAEYYGRLAAIQENNSYDLLDISGTPADWVEVLAVYAVKTTGDYAGQEVATMDDEKKRLLSAVFWDMTQIDWQLIAVTDTTTLLSIEISHKSAAEMIGKYGFNAEQRQQLAELLDEQHRELWQEVLYGGGAAGGNIVTVALLQVGNQGGEIYWRWYGFDSKVNWCACFVSWCAEQCGYIDAGVMPRFAGCSFGASWFKNSGLWQGSGYTPVPGDIIFFDWDDEGQDGIADHTGIVQKVEDGMVYTIEGNAADACRIKSYLLGYYEILGYGTPEY